MQFRMEAGDRTHLRRQFSGVKSHEIFQECFFLWILYFRTIWRAADRAVGTQVRATFFYPNLNLWPHAFLRRYGQVVKRLMRVAKFDKAVSKILLAMKPLKNLFNKFVLNVVFQVNKLIFFTFRKCKLGNFSELEEHSTRLICKIYIIWLSLKNSAPKRSQSETSIFAQSLTVCKLIDFESSLRNLAITLICFFFYSFKFFHLSFLARISRILHSVNLMLHYPKKTNLNSFILRQCP